MGFLNTQDLIAHHVALREASIDLQDPPGYSSEAPATSKLKVKLGESSKDKMSDGSLGKRKAAAPAKSISSAIKFGSSEPIELYKPRTNGKGKNSTTVSKLSVEIAKPSETTESQTKALNDKAMQQIKKKLAKSPVAAAPSLDTTIPASADSVAHSETHIKVSDSDTYVEWDNTELKLMRGAAKYKDCVLDIPLSFIKNLSGYQRSRLEENGFHTVSLENAYSQFVEVTLDGLSL